MVRAWDAGTLALRVTVGRELLEGDGGITAARFGPDGQRIVAAVIAGGVDRLEFEIREMGVAIAPVAGDAGLVVDDRLATADEPVE